MRSPPVSRLIGMLCLLLVVAGCANRYAAIEPQQNIPDAVAPPRPIPAGLWLPKGRGPFPAVIVLHGCDGVGGEELLWALRLNNWGYAALIVDSYGARGGAKCDIDGYVPPLAQSWDRAGDALSAALWLRTQPKIDGKRIGVFGTSVGGSVAALMTHERYEQLYPHLLRAAVSYYGSCWNPARQGSVPLLDMVGEADSTAHGRYVQECRDFAARLPPDKTFELHTYAGAYFGFDNPLVNYRYWGGRPVGYDAAAAEDSYTRTRMFLDRYVGASSG